MNKRKLLSVFAILLWVVLVVMTSIPGVYGGGPLWVHVFRIVAVGLLGVLFTVAAIVLAVLSFVEKDRAKLFITLSVITTWFAGTFMTFFGKSYAWSYSLSSYFVLCVPVLIWNLVLKTEAVAYSAQPAYAPQAAQPQATEKHVLFTKFLNTYTSNIAATQTATSAPIADYGVTPANSRKDKAFKDNEVKAYYNYLIEILCKRSAENYGNNAFMNQTELEQFVVSEFGINFNTKDKAVRKDKENKNKLKKFNKSLTLFERHNYGNGKVEIGMAEKDYAESKSKIDRLAQAEITELCAKIKPEIESSLKGTDKKTKADIPEEVRVRLEALSKDEAERFYATLSQETDDCIQIYEQENSFSLFGFARTIEALNNKYGIENGCVRSAISKAMTEIYMCGNATLKTVLGEFFNAQLNKALNGTSVDYQICVLYSVVARSLNYKNFKGKAVSEYKELSDDECNNIINSLLLREPIGNRLTPKGLKDYELKNIIDDSNIAEYNTPQFEDICDPVYRIKVISSFINRYIVNNNYLVNSIFLMDGSLYYYYEKLCRTNNVACETAQKDIVADFETMLANLYYFIGKQGSETTDNASENRRLERKKRQEEYERLEQQRQQERALDEQRDMLRKQVEVQQRFSEQQARQAEEQRRFNEQQAKQQARQAEEQRKLMLRQACATSQCPFCRHQCGMVSYSPDSNGGCFLFSKK